MNPDVSQALTEAATRNGLVDLDLLDQLPEFRERCQGVKTVTDARNVVHDLRELHPSLFKPLDWAKLSDPDYDEAEEKFLQGLRQPRTFGPTEFRDLDAARLSPEELHALDRCVTGQSNAFDRGALTRALARQKAEDTALSTGPGGAA